MSSDNEISIWFFIGVALFVNGLLIFSAGIWEFFRPPTVKVVLYQLHANVWWGAVLLLIGALYCLKFSPWRKQRAAAEVRSISEARLRQLTQEPSE